MKYIIPKFSILIIFAAITLVGMAMISMLNLQLNPSRTLPSITVSFNWPGNEARVVEQEITSRLEAVFARVNGIKDINSTSRNGGGKITLTLHKGANMDAVRFEISMLVRQLWQALPRGASYPVIEADRPDNERERPMLGYIITARLSPQEIYRYAEDEIKRKFSSIPGVGKVQVSGAEPFEWLIEYNSQALEKLNISSSDIQDAISRYIEKQGLGLVFSQSAPNQTDTVGNVRNYIPLQLSHGNVIVQNLTHIPVQNLNGRIIYLSELASLKYQETRAQSHYRVRGLNTIHLSVYAQPGQNQLSLGKKIKEIMNGIHTQQAGKYHIELEYDANEYIQKELYRLGWRFFLALGLLLIFIFAIYRQTGYMFLILATFVVNLSMAAIFYYLFRVEIHLYSLAAITVSLGLMTDNIIVMADHLRNRGNLTAWLAILAATMALASTLVIIFFLDEKIKASLVDFALVVVINQSVSLLTALFFVPAFIKQFKIGKNLIIHPSQKHLKKFEKKIRKRKRALKIKMHLVRIQRWIYLRMMKRKWIPYTVFVLAFGLPVFLLPAKWEGNSWYHSLYNKTLGSDLYTSGIKPITDKALGGTLRLFVNYVFEGSYFRQNQETSLYITASLPHGSTIEHANKLSDEMEQWLRQFREIKTFQANVQPRRIWINVFFKNEHQFSSFPYQLKSMAVSKAIELGGAYWGVYGFGDGFSNETRENAGMYMVKMYGYNYETLLDLAGQLQKKLKENERVTEIYILPERSWFKPDNMEFTVKLNHEKAIKAGISAMEVFAALKNNTPDLQAFARVYNKGVFENIRMQPEGTENIDIWNLNHIPLTADSSIFRFNTLCRIEKELVPQSVCKENQQYRLFLQFDYIGSDKFARKYIKKTVEDFQLTLPMGYTAKDQNDYFFWIQAMKKTQYWLIVLIIAAIFFICAILFESLRFPIAVILTIPSAFIGVFLTFYWFDLNFDQGGFAAFILLCGLTVGAAIYIVNDYSVLRRKHKDKNRKPLQMYLKSFQYKIIPILLTMSSTMLGFLPFLLSEKQAFWFSMAAGVIGGLVFALLGIFFYLPLFLGIRNK